MFRNSRHERKLLRPAIFMFLGLTVSVTGQVRVPPGRAPQRSAILQYMSGEVSVAPSATNQWTAARLNQPLTPSEYVWTAANSRAEINVGDGLIRMNSEASLTVVALNPSNVQVGVNQGEVSLTVLRLPPGEIYEYRYSERHTDRNQNRCLSRRGQTRGGADFGHHAQRLHCGNRSWACGHDKFRAASDFLRWQLVAAYGRESTSSRRIRRLGQRSQQETGSRPAAFCGWIWIWAMALWSNSCPRSTASTTVLAHRIFCTLCFAFSQSPRRMAPWDLGSAIRIGKRLSEPHSEDVSQGTS